MSNIDKRHFRADGGDISTGRLREIADNPYGDEEKCWLAKRVLALLDEVEAKDKRLAELERSETQLIDERDNAESALNDAYTAVMGQKPEWSNWFSFADAVDEIALACGLWRNQTEDVIQFRARIAELEAREVRLPELCVGVVQGGHAVMVPYAAGHWFNKTAILEMLADAGINIAAAAKGEAS